MKNYTTRRLIIILFQLFMVSIVFVQVQIFNAYGSQNDDFKNQVTQIAYNAHFPEKMLQNIYKQKARDPNCLYGNN